MRGAVIIASRIIPVYPDEGHGFARPENVLDSFGRAEPWRAVPGSSAEVR